MNEKQLETDFSKLVTNKLKSKDINVNIKCNLSKKHLVYILESAGISNEISVSIKETPLMGEVDKSKPCLTKISTSGVNVKNKMDANYDIFLAKLEILGYLVEEISKGKEGYLDKTLAKLYKI